jgi:hypothetical protein
MSAKPKELSTQDTTINTTQNQNTTSQAQKPYQRALSTQQNKGSNSKKLQFNAVDENASQKNTGNKTTRDADSTQ